MDSPITPGGDILILDGDIVPFKLMDKHNDFWDYVSSNFQYDSELQWPGKTERTSFERPTVSLHVHDRIDPNTLIDSVKKEDAKHEQMQNSLNQLKCSLK